jgi:hypothetical protein
MANTPSERFLAWVAAHLDAVCSVLRWVKPTVVFGGNAFVTRFDDVQEVLSRDWIFQVPYAKKMVAVTNGSNFFLGMQDTPEYTRDVSNMRGDSLGRARQDRRGAGIDPRGAHSAHRRVFRDPGMG